MIVANEIHFHFHQVLKEVQINLCICWKVNVTSYLVYLIDWLKLVLVYHHLS